MSSDEKRRDDGRSPGAASTGASSTGSKGTDPVGSDSVDFSTFIISLSTSAMYHLGAIPDPDTQKPEINIPLARQTVDILGMIREKTEGNRSPDETRLLDSLLYDLRLRFVSALEHEDG